MLFLWAPELLDKQMFRKKSKSLQQEISKVINLETNFGQWLLGKLIELKFDPNTLSTECVNVILEPNIISDKTKRFRWVEDQSTLTNTKDKCKYCFAIGTVEDDGEIISDPKTVYLDQDHTSIYV